MQFWVLKMILKKCFTLNVQKIIGTILCLALNSFHFYLMHILKERLEKEFKFVSKLQVESYSVTHKG